MKGQRRKHEPGDLFVLQLERDDTFRFGRIVKMGVPTKEARFPGQMLVYLYDVPAVRPDVPRESLTPDRLLMPPFFTLSWMWHKGYFRMVDHEPISDRHLLKQHCFYSGAYDGYVDENDRRLDRRYEPCGWFSLSTFVNLESEIESALNGNPVYGRHPAGDQ